jgi:putative ABC transport system ATP-binding protein
VMENVLLPLYPSGMRQAEMRRRGHEVLGRLDLESKKHVNAGKLSGGEQQRVAIARALINKPEIIVADEPTAHLDRRLSEELLQILEGLNRDGKTVLIATHDPLVFDSPFVDRTLAMRDGRIEAEQGR